MGRGSECSSPAATTPTNLEKSENLSAPTGFKPRLSSHLTFQIFVSVPPTRQPVQTGTVGCPCKVRVSRIELHRFSRNCHKTTPVLRVRQPPMHAQDRCQQEDETANWLRTLLEKNKSTDGCRWRCWPPTAQLSNRRVSLEVLVAHGTTVRRNRS